MVKINLAPQEILYKQKQSLHMIQASAVGMFVVIAILGISFAHLRKAKNLESNLATLKAEHESLQPKVQEVGRLQGEINLLKAKLNAIQELLRGRLTYPRFMDSFLRAMPGGVWINTLQAHISGPGKVKWSVSANSLQSEDIADWISVFDESAEYSEVTLGAISMREQQNVSQFSFNVQGTFQSSEKD